MNKEKGKKLQKIEPTEEGWTPEMLLWFIAAIELALEKPENKKMIQKVREATEEYQLLPESEYIK